MLVEHAVKVRIYPTSEQENLLLKTLGCKRWCWNYWLEEREAYFHEHGNTTGFQYTSARELKEVHPWLVEPDSIALQQARRDLDTAYNRYFKKLGGHPKFKGKHGKQSYRTHQTNGNIAIDFERQKLKLPKVGWIAYRDDRVFDEGIKQVTVSRTKSGHHFASILIEKDIDIQEKTTVHESDITAFDMSCAAFMVGNGTDHFSNPRFYRKHENKLKKLHRQVSRKQKGSNNRDKARVKLARFYDRIGNRRNDWQHKLSTLLASDHDVIIIEDLNIDGMKRFNGGIAKTITLDFSWGEFARMLDYKLERLGKHIVKVDRFYPSSKLCSNCGYKHDALKLSEREWTCPGCGTRHDRDVNAARNLLAEGKRILLEERNITIINSSTAGTAGSHASGDPVRPVALTARIDERRIHTLIRCGSSDINIHPGRSLISRSHLIIRGNQRAMLPDNYLSAILSTTDKKKMARFKEILHVLSKEKTRLDVLENKILARFPDMNDNPKAVRALVYALEEHSIVAHTKMRFDDVNYPVLVYRICNDDELLKKEAARNELEKVEKIKEKFKDNTMIFYCKNRCSPKLYTYEQMVDSDGRCPINDDGMLVLLEDDQKRETLVNFISSLPSFMDRPGILSDVLTSVFPEEPVAVPEARAILGIDVPPAIVLPPTKKRRDARRHVNDPFEGLQKPTSDDILDMLSWIENPSPTDLVIVIVNGSASVAAPGVTDDAMNPRAVINRHGINDGALSTGHRAIGGAP